MGFADVFFIDHVLSEPRIVFPMSQTLEQAVKMGNVNVLESWDELERKKLKLE